MCLYVLIMKKQPEHLATLIRKNVIWFMEEAHQFPSDKICTKCVPAWDWRAASNLPGPNTHTHTFRWTILKLLFLLGDSWCPLPVDMGEMDMQVLCWVLAGLSAFAQGLASRADSLEWLALDFCAKGGKQKISEAGLRGWTVGSSHLDPFSDCQLLLSGKEQWWHDQGNKFGFCLQP